MVNVNALVGLVHKAGNVHQVQSTLFSRGFFFRGLFMRQDFEKPRKNVVSRFVPRKNIISGFSAKEEGIT